MISFLNALLPENEEITDITYHDKEQLGESFEDRRAVYDLFCTNQRGEKFIIEVQRASQEFLKIVVSITPHFLFDNNPNKVSGGIMS